jgi:diguanylate cyclase
VRQLNSLKDLGVRLVMDDFGKGFSLSYLRSLPVDVLKIDQSFVLGAAEPNDRALLRAAVDMAYALELRVVAEGSRIPSTSRECRIRVQTFAQGFFFEKPRESLETI